MDREELSRLRKHSQGPRQAPGFFSRAKACPCKKHFRVRIHYAPREGWSVFCDACGRVTGPYEHPDDAIDAWNGLVDAWQVFEDL
jgi:hypothetical protein